MKRLFDIFFSSAGLLFLWPIFSCIAIAIVLTDGWPVFFRQQRVGRNGNDFKLFKFRSMSVLKEAEARRFDAENGSRVTPVGRFIRKTKIDELPQLWNVFRGHMSVVGPRPEIRKWVDEYPERWNAVLAVRPGITDPASIRFRNEEEMLAQASDPEVEYREVILPQKLDLYEEYVASASFLGDLELIYRTVLVVIRK